MSPRLHALLRRLLPPSFRRRHGAAMGDVFEEALADARGRGWGAVARLWWREALDLTTTGRRLRTAGRGAHRTTGTGGGGGMWTILDDLRNAARSVVRRPGTALFAAGTLALGVGSTTAIFTTLEGVVLHPLPYEGSERIASLFRRPEGASVSMSPTGEQVEAVQAQTDLIEGAEPWMVQYPTLTDVGEPRQITLGLIRPSFHELVGRPPLLGRAFSAEELKGSGEHVLLLSYGMWTEGFGRDREVLGRTVTLDGEPWTIVGVMPRRTVLPGWGAVDADAWAPLSDERAATPTSVTAMLRPGVDVATLNARLKEVVEASAEPGEEKWTVEARLARELVSSAFGDSLKILTAAVVLLLLVACVNLSHLLLSSANARRRETAVRAALGAGRGRLVRHLLLETLLISLVGGALGVALAFGGQALMVALRPDRLSALDMVRVNGRVLLFALALTVTTGMLFGLVPALRAGRAGAMAPLRSGARTDGDRLESRFQWSLVSGEVALSFALLVGALLVVSALAKLSRRDVGFSADQLLVLKVALPRWKFEASEYGPLQETLAERLRALPAVRRVSETNGVPGTPGIWFGQLRVEGSESAEGSQIIFGLAIDDGYFQTMEQPLLAGRAMTVAEIRDRADVMVIGEETARRFFGGPDAAVGQRFVIGDGDWQTVVGVTRDVPMAGLGPGATDPQGYWPLRQSSERFFAIRVSEGLDPADLAPVVRDLTLALEPEVRIDRLETASGILADSLDRERFTLSIVAAFAGMALLLAAVGLYGVLSHVVGGRVREIGIRVALGATRGKIRRIVLRRAGVATAIGIASGAGLAFAGVRVLKSQLFGLDESRPGAFVLAAAVLAATALLAAYLPVRRATRVDPVEAMRAD